MDLLEYLEEDHDRLRRVLDRLSVEICQGRDERDLPSGWKVRSEAELVRALRLLLPALVAHEELEEKLLFRALRDAGVTDQAPFRALGGDHKELESLVQGLAAVLTEAQEKPAAWLVTTTMRLVDTLRAHMRKEEYEVFPMVRSTLTRKDLLKLGRRAEAILRPV